jgi:hypothetical protein
MSDASVRLKPIKAALDHLFLDPNNPRFAKSLNLPGSVLDTDIVAAQERLEKLFVNEKDSDAASDDDDSEAEEGAVRIGDLICSMQEIGFVPIDRVVVRQLDHSAGDYVVIEGNRRVRSAKYLRTLKVGQGDRERHEEVLRTLNELDVLLLDTDGLSSQQRHDQIGVILGLRHFGQVLPWGTLAKAVNIYHEYMNAEPAQAEFRLDNKRISQVATRLSQTRSGVMSALKTYIGYRQLQDAFPNGQPKPGHYSLLQACATNRKLGAASYIEQDGNTFQLSAASLENLNTACEFENRDTLSEEKKILKDPKSVSSFAGLIAAAANHRDSATKAFATSLKAEVLAKERSLNDAVDNLRSFESDRVWTESLVALLLKVVEPGAPPGSVGEVEKQRLLLKDFMPAGNDLLRLEEARKAFRNVRTILGI